MATIPSAAGSAPEGKRSRKEIPVGRAEAIRLNPFENTSSDALRAVFDGLPVLVFLERDGKILFANAEARRLLGGAEGAWTPCPVEDVLWGLFPGTAEPQTQLTGTETGHPFHATIPAHDGRLISVEGTYSILNPQSREAVIVAHPSDRSRAPRSRLMEDVLASLPEAVAIEYENHVLYTNPAFTRMFGYTPEEAAGGSLRDLIVPETRLDEHVGLLKAVGDHGLATTETVRSNNAAELVDVSLQIAPLLVDKSRVGYVYTFRDIGVHKQTEEKLQHDAMHDVLTGLPNRALFLDHVNLTLNRRLRNPEQGCGVLYVDLDEFKEVNDSLGHAAGDALLVAVAGRLRASLRPQDSAARLGGDEFAVLVESILSASDLEIVATRILHELERPLEVFGREVRAGASIGGALAGPDHVSSDLLLRDADVAMYRAKQAGGARVEIYDKHLEVAITSHQERERELRSAVNKRQFVFQYQPIFSLSTGMLEGFETLFSLRHGGGAADSFDDLLAFAEDTGLSIQLGKEVLDAVCAQLRILSDRLPEQELMLTVNLTRRQLYHPDLIAHLMKAFATSGADPSRLIIEAPESAFNENPDAALAVLQRLADWQVRTAIDDFGGSLAPLNHLVHLPVAMIKLAPRLTVSALSSGRQLAVLESLVRLGNTLGLQIVAQGIETSEQLTALSRMGCSLGQGPLLSPPLDPERAIELAATGYWAFAPGT
jgi:diguanylate cyclase (GGDEF)-like protein/PAS domain S-box-containing protein